MKIQSISAAEFVKKLSTEKLSILDVRTLAEVRRDALEDTIIMPLDQLSVKRLESQLNSGTEVYVICQRGQRARKASEKLSLHLPQSFILVEGGMEAIRRAQGIKPFMSIERQLRIAAGSLVLLGVLSGFYWHPAGFILSGFIGAGLIFSGISNTCAMRLLIVKAPWNR